MKTMRRVLVKYTDLDDPIEVIEPLEEVAVRGRGDSGPKAYPTEQGEMLLGFIRRHLSLRAE